MAGYELNELNEETPTVLVSDAQPDDPTLDDGPLDEVIAASMASRYDRAAIAAIAARTAARAGGAGATAVDRLIADDWRRVLAMADGDAPDGP